MKPLVARLRDTSALQAKCGYPVSAALLAEAADALDAFDAAIPCEHEEWMRGEEGYGYWQVCGEPRAAHEAHDGKTASVFHEYQKPEWASALDSEGR